MMFRLLSFDRCSLTPCLSSKESRVATASPNVCICEKM